jgi:hypothetical protein
MNEVLVSGPAAIERIARIHLRDADLSSSAVERIPGDEATVGLSLRIPMLRRALLPLLLLVGLLAAVAPRSAQADPFQDYAYYGTLNAYYGTLYNYEVLRIASESDFSSDAIETAYEYSYYSFYYGYYGLIYEYADWVLAGGEYADAAKEYSKGIYEYTQYTLVPEYPYAPIYAVAENSYWGWICEAYAEAYLKISYSYAFELPADVPIGD